MPAQGHRASELQKWDLSLSLSAFSFCHSHSGPGSSMLESLSFTTTLSCLPLSERTRPLFLALPFLGLAGVQLWSCWSCVTPSVYLVSAYVLCVCSVVSDSLPWQVCSLPSSTVRGDPPGKNTRMGCHFLLQGIFPAQGSNPHLHWQEVSLPLSSHQGSP